MWMRLSRKCVRGNKGLLTPALGDPVGQTKEGGGGAIDWGREPAGHRGLETQRKAAVNLVMNGVKGQQSRSNAGIRDIGQRTSG